MVGKSGRHKPANTGLVFGRRSVAAFVSRFPDRVLSLEIVEAQAMRHSGGIVEQVKEHGIAVQTVQPKTLEAYAQGASHQGICARIRPAQELPEQDLEAYVPDHKPSLILVLDRVQDPHNLGACLRTAEATGVDLVIAPRNQAVGLTPTVRKVASGAAEFVPYLRVTNLSRTLTRLKELNVWCVALSGEAEESLYDVDLTGSVALVLGSEGAGIRELTKKTCDRLASLPLMGEVGSLNVSVATGVGLYEVLRQRRET
ncbi:MAG: 23S rRNA (guanosine(2251)-2'-O)-methyltransferase RlmB [Pseudomonadota bacterium]